MRTREELDQMAHEKAPATFACDNCQHWGDDGPDETLRHLRPEIGIVWSCRRVYRQRAGYDMTDREAELADAARGYLATGAPHPCPAWQLKESIIAKWRIGDPDANPRPPLREYFGW